MIRQYRDLKPLLRHAWNRGVDVVLQGTNARYRIVQGLGSMTGGPTPIMNLVWFSISFGSERREWQTPANKAEVVAFIARFVTAEGAQSSPGHDDLPLTAHGDPDRSPGVH
jgi:hypothetical protein